MSHRSKTLALVTSMTASSLRELSSTLPGCYITCRTQSCWVLVAKTFLLGRGGNCCAILALVVPICGLDQPCADPSTQPKGWDRTVSCTSAPGSEVLNGMLRGRFISKTWQILSSELVGECRNGKRSVERILQHICCCVDLQGRLQSSFPGGTAAWVPNRWPESHRLQWEHKLEMFPLCHAGVH